MNQTQQVIAEHDDGDWPTNAIEFVAWLAAQIETVPAGYRHSVEIEIIAEEYDADDYAPVITLTYQRPETEAEEQVRVKKEAFSAAVQREFDLRKIADLKAKYPEEFKEAEPVEEETSK